MAVDIWWVGMIINHRGFPSYIQTLGAISRKWREEHIEMLTSKDKAEEEALEEMTSQAKVDLSEWYARHADQISQTKGTNR